MASSSDGGIPHRGIPRRRPYTPEEWEAKREVISQLYSAGVKQPALLATLQQQDPNFRPTLAMLKKRIHAWGLDKKHKEAEVLAAFQLAFERQKQGKDSVFIIRGRPVTLKEMYHYMKRKGIQDVPGYLASRVNSGSRATTEPASAVQAITPQPSPTYSKKTIGTNQVEDPDQDDDLIEHLSLDLASGAVVVAGINEEVALALAGPPELELLQQALNFITRYYGEIFNIDHLPRGGQTLPSMLPESKRLSIFTDNMWSGRELLFEGEFTSAFDYFDKAFNSVHAILKDQSRKFLPEFFEMLLNFQLEDNFDILHTLLKFLVELPGANPSAVAASKIAAALIVMDKVQKTEAVERLMSNTLVRFRDVFGEEHPETQSIIKALSRSIFRRKPLREAISFLKKRLAESGQKVDEDDNADDDDMVADANYESCGIFVEIALCYRFARDFDRAEAWVGRGWRRAAGLVSVVNRTDIQVRCLRVLFYIKKQQGQWQLAYALAREAVDLAAEGLGPEDSLTTLVRAELDELERQMKREGVLLFLSSRSKKKDATEMSSNIGGVPRRQTGHVVGEVDESGSPSPLPQTRAATVMPLRPIAGSCGDSVVANTTDLRQDISAIDELRQGGLQLPHTQAGNDDAMSGFDPAVLNLDNFDPLAIPVTIDVGDVQVENWAAEGDGRQLTLLGPQETGAVELEDWLQEHLAWPDGDECAALFPDPAPFL